MAAHEFYTASLSTLLAALAIVAVTLPKTIQMYRKDRAGFVKSMKLAGVYMAYCSVAIGIMLLLVDSKTATPPQTRAMVLTAFMLIWIMYGGIWLARLLPRHEQIPSWLERRPSFVDYAFIAAIVGSLAAAVTL